ncbi:MAG TPA: alkaline phosphatase D family protein [Methylomirabilota bacterium]
MAAEIPLLVATGDVTSTSAVVWARGVHPGTLDVVVGAAGGASSTRHSLLVTPARDLTGKLTLSGLAPATRYAVRVSQDDARAEAEFVSAPAPDAAARVAFLWSGDLGGGGWCRPLDGGYRVFRPMLERRADFFLFVGDTIYADVPCGKPGVAPGADFRARTLAEYHARHRYQREDPPLQALLRATSVYAIWDDHEVRNDFSGPHDPLMPTGRQALLDYWPIATPDDEPTRLYRRFRWGRLLEVFILDTRQYRSLNSETDGPRKTMLGAAQKRWLLDAVTSSAAVWKVVVTSVSLSIPTGRPEARDSWTGASPFGLPVDGAGFVAERDAILEHLRKHDVKNLVFVTADVHHAEVIRHEPMRGWSFHELVAGPLSATMGRPRPPDLTLNPRSLFGRGGVFNFGEVVIEPAGLTVRLIDDTGAVMFTHTLKPN